MTSTTLTITSDPTLVGGRRMKALAAAHTQLTSSSSETNITAAATSTQATILLKLWEKAEAVSGHKAAAVSKGVG